MNNLHYLVYCENKNGKGISLSEEEFRKLIEAAEQVLY